MITQRDFDRINNLTRRAVEKFNDMVEVEALLGYEEPVARQLYNYSLTRLGEALNQSVGRPKELVMRELREQLERWEESKCKI